MADDDEKELKDQRVVTMMTPSELEAIDDWMFKNRIRSRGEAIRRLCRIGLLWDGISDALNKQIGLAVEDAKGKADRYIEVLGDPADDNPPWISRFVVAAMQANIAAIEHLAEIAAIVRMAGSPADVMKLEGDISEIRDASVFLEAEIIKDALEEYRKKRAE